MGGDHGTVATDGRRRLPRLGEPESVVHTVFGCDPGDVAEEVVLSPFVPLKAFRRHVEEPVRELAPPFFYKGFTAGFGGRRVTVILTGVGPGRVGDCLGFLALTPARRVCFAGAVGALNPAYHIGEFFLPTGAADGEGYSRYCREPFAEVAGAAPVVPCPGGGQAELGDLLGREGIAVRRGKVFTIGSVAFESTENLNTLRDLGFDALEMELSAFFAAAAHHGFAASALTYVSDLPLTRSLWQQKTAGERDALRRAYRALPRLALRQVCREGGS